MPERSEWLVAEGERSVTLGIVTSSVMRLKDAKIGFLGSCFRVFQTLFFEVVGIPGVALTLNPRLRALGLPPKCVQPFRLDTLHAINRITIKVMPNNRGAAAY